MWGINRGLGVLGLLALTATSSLTAQTVRGQVVDSLSGAPVGGGFVALLDADGNEVARTLTDRAGRFVLQVTSAEAGPFRIRSERIGYRYAETEPFPVPEEGAPVNLVRVTALPTPLQAIEVHQGTQCRVRPPRDDAASIVWQEAQKALAAASWTASQQRFTIVSTVYTRDVIPRRDEVLSERHQRSGGLSSTPFVSRAPELLARDGYAIDADGGTAFFAPDAEVFQHASFLDTHCFQLTQPDDAGIIGLTFEPIPSRRLPDVAGVLWLDRTSSELRSIEYEYANLPVAIRGDDKPGGYVEFMALPSGAWIVHRWQIRIPTAFQEERVNPFDREPTRRVTQRRDVGGEVLTIDDVDGTRVYQAPRAAVTGTVIDSSLAVPRPLASATVSIPGTWFSTRTDGNGAYHLDVPLDGRFPLAFSHPRFDSLGYLAEPSVVDLNRGASARVSMAVPPLRDILARRCPSGTFGEEQRALVGVVRGAADDAPVAGARIIAAWQRIASNLDFRDLQVEATTDASGRFIMCGLDVGRPAVVVATVADGRSTPVRVAFEPTHVAIGDRGYDAPHPVFRFDPIVAPHATALSIAGIVRDAVSDSPLVGAEVVVGETGLVVATDSSGLFQISGLDADAVHLTIRHPGYYSQAGTLRLDEGGPTLVGAEWTALTPESRIFGTVTDADTDTPTAGVDVALVSPIGDTLAIVRSDSVGAYALTAPEPGAYFVSARRIGTQPIMRGPIRLRPGRVVEVDIAFDATAVYLAPITVTAEAMEAYLSDVGFYDRQRANHGYFMEREEIETRLGSVNDAAQLLSHVPGVAIGEPQPGTFGSSISLNTRAGCGQPVVYVDGFRIEIEPVGAVHSGQDGASQNFLGLMTMVQPEDIYAIEIYRSPSQVPAQYGGAWGARCGVLLIWTVRG